MPYHCLCPTIAHVYTIAHMPYSHAYYCSHAVYTIAHMLFILLLTCPTIALMPTCPRPGGNCGYQHPGEYHDEPGPQYQGQNCYEHGPGSRCFNQPPQEGFQQPREKDPNASLAVDPLRILLHPGVLRTYM